MPAPNSRPRSRPEPAAIEAPGLLARWWDTTRGLVVVPTPGRLAALGGLAALTVALLVVLVERTKGGFDRSALRQLASETTNPAPPARPGYIKR